MKKPSSESGSSLGVQKSDQDVTAVFKRTEVIGRGKFGVVYKGYHVRTKQVYAIKVLNLDSDEDEVEDVQREVQFLASMKQTPNITHYYGSYLRDTSLWVIIEYCAGGSLRTLLRPGKIDEKYIGIIMREVLIALKYIHKDNVIHRDIKAANVLITNEGHVKLCDFGVAAQLNHTSLKRQTMAGTPYWMAPEVIMEGVYYDTKVDIWSLGITTYEIATGNPPYCDVEALRAMQLITKSKPPRLEGRHYSPMLKEFIALCLDEDPKERQSADDLLKTKFIKQHKTSSTAVLKELITRYLLFRDKNKTRRESISMADMDLSPSEIVRNKSEERGQSPNSASSDNTNINADTNSMQVELRWDFDSLSSSDYIIQHDINVEEIPEESTVDWKSHFDQFNFAYPDEERYYYQTGNNTTTQVYQGTTMGKTQPSTIFNNSTLNAPLTSNNTTGHPSKVLNNGNTNTAGVTGTHNNSTGSNKKAEAKAPKKLMELFEDNDVINEEESIDPEISRLPKNVPSDLSGRPHGALMNNAAYHSHSTPALPLLQTKFNKPLKAPTSAVTTAPTPIEIEIPEELPMSATASSGLLSALPSSFLSTSMDPLAPSQPLSATHTKPRSSTFSSSHASYKQSLGLSGRATMGREVPGKITEEVSRRGSNSAGSSSDGSIGSAINTGASTGSGSAQVKRPLRTPSPSRVLLNHMSSPTKKPAGSPTAPPPTMKPMGASNDNKDVLLQPLNNGTPTSINSTNSGVTGSNANGPAVSDKDSSRVNRDFKRNNPNLKLHMPLPTPMMPTKLLDTTDLASSGAPGSENINQFGFNTSSATNVPVSMTPISEKHMDFGNRLKRSQSVANRKNSQSTDPALLANPHAATSMKETTSSTPQGCTANQLVQPPPEFLNMDLFLDMRSEGGEYRFVDSKPKMLDKLEMLLKMYEEGLPVLENALKKQLLSMELTYDECTH
ncbi:BN860_02850g1_1 [Zygosaccharomyces bailii CLIB 213]|uniref:non-specific serine/threonine protein kinase n=1 Tax=Zygosaccharomyces bailii (strain CLIB 213 / ATCC 58445 / CBS 680 / BCRC 21525 / NBRC 1098 / NCYC 1416 / NRRL Y-2227) TaxID=1333698 RepID=A0A8J2SZQ4_ZYGB2|nr:BN860_02850g1_1 [Zygosaccharomyces bailii CLIB 213]